MLTSALSIRETQQLQCLCNASLHLMRSSFRELPKTWVQNLEWTSFMFVSTPWRLRKTSVWHVGLSFAPFFGSFAYCPRSIEGTLFRLE